MDKAYPKENRVHSSEKKPFSYYKCMIPNWFGCVPMHWHSEFELNFIREGAAEVICGKEKFTSQAGDIIITQPNVLHSIYPCPNISQKYDTLVFSREIFCGSEQDRYFSDCINPLVNGTMRIPVHITSEHHYYSELQKITENIFACAKGDRPRLDMLMRSELIRLFWLLGEEAEAAPEIGDPADMIRPALEYVAEHFAEKITIGQLAGAVHLSESYFMERFRKHVGLSAVEYISHFRIEKACRKLLDSDETVLGIAYDCGFYNISNFNRQFKRIAGCSPSEYRSRSKI